MNKNRFRKVILFLGVLIVLILVLGALTIYVAGGIVKTKKILNTPPSIIVHTPSEGDSVPEGSEIITHATIFGQNPIARVEIWLDGEWVAEQSPDPSLGGSMTTIYADFALEIPLGDHMLVWRAIDSNGLVGQSFPIDIRGAMNPNTIATKEISAEEGQTLTNIAAAVDVDPRIVRELNPDLGPGELPDGTQVNIPKDPVQDGGGGTTQGNDNQQGADPPDGPTEQGAR